MNMKKIFMSCVLLCLMVCFINGCGNSSKPTKIEDEVVAYLNQLTDKYGEIGYDAQYIYCDGEYHVDANDHSELYIDLMEKKEELESGLDKVLLAGCVDTYNEYKNNEQELTYEEFKSFERGYIKVDFDILHEMMKKE